MVLRLTGLGQLLSDSHNQDGPWEGCRLVGIPLSDDRHLGNLGIDSRRKNAGELLLTRFQDRSCCLQLRS